MTDARDTGLTLNPKYDRDGLITAVVTDDASGEVLMVAHMNAQALALTVDTGLAHFWSRSRQALWKKGETSGHMLQVRDIRFLPISALHGDMVVERGPNMPWYTGYTLLSMLENLEIWMPDAPDALKWLMEEPLDQKRMEMPEMPLPDALEDLIGELLQEAEEFEEEADDIT